MPPQPSAQPPTPLSMGRWNSPAGRLALVALLFLCLQLPLAMLRGLVFERQAARDTGSSEVMGKWGGSQQIVGPLLRIPFQWVDERAEGLGRPGVPVLVNAHAFVLPAKLDVEVRVESQKRRRGLFEVPVYSAEVVMSGYFERPDSASWRAAPEHIDWSRSQLFSGISDVRALHADSELSWAETRLHFQPSTGEGPGLGLGGVHAVLPSEPFPTEQVPFRIRLRLNGSQGLNVAPVGQDTRVQIASNWPHPSFQGAWLPVESQIEATGFSALWTVSYLGRNYPQGWTSQSAELPALAEALAGSVFGVNLIEPVDTYRMAERVTKYASLPLIFTFVMLWLIELLSRRPVHPIQYGMLGAALCLFGLLQLALAEHFGFWPGYLVASVAVIGLVTFYSRSALGGWLRALAMGALLGGLYGYLYVLLSAEDYALLGGSVALFVGLALVMWLTRRFDWNLGQPAG